ncbi:MAG: YceI family protein [Niabella sp.]
MKRLNLLTLIVLISTSLFAQQTYTLQPSKSRNIVAGTSTLHDWRCVAEQQSGTAEIDVSKGLNIKSLSAKIVAKSLKSIKENDEYFDASMDKNTYKALNADKYPEIVYVLTGISNLKKSGATSTFTATGNLTISGKTNQISFPAKAVINGKAIVFTGSVKFNLTSFGITPPKALMGTIKTGDEVTIILNTTYAR